MVPLWNHYSPSEKHRQGLSSARTPSGPLHTWFGAIRAAADRQTKGAYPLRLASLSSTGVLMGNRPKQALCPKQPRSSQPWSSVRMKTKFGLSVLMALLSCDNAHFGCAHERFAVSRMQAFQFDVPCSHGLFEQHPLLNRVVLNVVEPTGRNRVTPGLLRAYPASATCLGYHRSGRPTTPRVVCGRLRCRTTHPAL